MKKLVSLIIAIICILGATTAFAGETKSNPDLEDGSYPVEVELEGDLGVTTMKNPCEVQVFNGKATAVIEWSDSHVQYMYLDGKKIHRIDTISGHTTFELTVKEWDEPFVFQVETNDKGTPRMVDCTITFKSEGLVNNASGLGRHIIKLAIVVAAIIVVICIYGVVKKKKAGAK